MPFRTLDTSQICSIRARGRILASLAISVGSYMTHVLCTVMASNDVENVLRSSIIGYT